MTRINCGIPPAELTDKHLLAEHREIKRIPNAVIQGKANFRNGIPEKFTLGKGHVRFFYDKLWYLWIRYQAIYDECIKRGFNVTPFHAAFDHHPSLDHCFKDYTPTDEDRAIVRARIKERLTQ